MALIFIGRSKCAICDSTIESADGCVATSPFVTDPDDPLWRFSDAVMHRRCFLGCADRESIVRRFNQAKSSCILPDGSHHEMTPEGEIVVVTANGAR